MIQRITHAGILPERAGSEVTKLSSLESLVFYFDEHIGREPEYLRDKYHQSNDEGKEWILVGYRKVV
jgi:hypothetical protein